MNNPLNALDPAVRALAELQLSNWQELGDQLTDQQADEASLQYVDKMTALLRSQLGPSTADTHVRSTTHPDEAAFVIPEQESGLSKREYIAAHIVAGLVANPGTMAHVYEIATQATAQTDALIEALNAKRL